MKTKNNKYHNGKSNHAPRNGAKNFREKEQTGKGSSNGNNSLNDVSWYTKYPDLLRTAASYPYPNKPGMKYRLLDYVQVDNNLDVTYSSFAETVIPGACAIEFVPSVGWSDSNVSPISTAAKEWYARVRSKYSGSLRADAPDFLMYVMGLDSIYSYISYLQRMYRCINMFESDDFTMPENLLHLMGLSDSSIQALRAQHQSLYETIVTLTRQAGRFRCPDVMDVVTRHFWMNQHVYADAPHMNSQKYMFVQQKWYRFGVDDQGAGQLEAIAPPSTLTFEDVDDPIADLLEYGIGLIEALNAGDDNYDISGYLERAFEGSKNFVIPEVQFGERQVVSYQPEVLVQIENSKAVEVASSTLKITQDPSTNAILHTPSIKYGDMPKVQCANMINVTNPTPSVEENVIATRLMCAYDYSFVTNAPVPSDDTLIPIVAGTEIVIGYRLRFPKVQKLNGMKNKACLVDFYTNTSAINIGIDDNPGIFSMLPEETAKTFALLGAVSQFECFPIMTLTYIVNQGPGEYEDMGSILLGRINNITTITDELLADVHRVATYSEFNAFSIA